MKEVNLNDIMYEIFEENLQYASESISFHVEDSTEDIMDIGYETSLDEFHSYIKETFLSRSVILSDGTKIDKVYDVYFSQEEPTMYFVDENNDNYEVYVLDTLFLIS